MLHVRVLVRMILLAQVSICFFNLAVTGIFLEAEQL